MTNAIEDGDKPALIENVPSTWTIRRFKHVATTAGQKPTDMDRGIPYIGLEHVESWTGKIQGPVDQMEDNTSNVCQPGDVLFGKLRPYLAKVCTPLSRLRCSSEFLVLRSQSYYPDFLKYIVVSLGFIDLVNSSTYGAKMPRASWEFIGDIRMPVPPMDVQRHIARFLDVQTAKLDALVEKKQRLIELLQEYRQALITQAVTKGLDPNAPMKDSGIEWLGEVPVHWRVVRLKFLADVRSGVTKGRNLTGRQTVEIPYLRVANVQDGYLDLSDMTTIPVMPHEVERYALRDGDVLMNEGGDFDKLGRGARWNGEIDLCLHQNHVFAVRPKDIAYSDWINAYTSSEPAKHYFIMKSKQSTNLASISSSNIKELQIPLPEREGRDAILANLSQMTAALEKAVSLLQTQIKGIQEYRQTLISAAVTGQIDAREYAVNTEVMSS